MLPKIFLTFMFTKIQVEWSNEIIQGKDDNLKTRFLILQYISVTITFDFPPNFLFLHIEKWSVHKTDVLN